MQQLFLADLHLGENTPEILGYFQQFIHYCEKNLDDISSIYILGDFFELWIGDDYIESENSSEALSSVIAKLNWLSQQSIQTFFMHGNRDFLIAEQFQHLTGFKLLPDPYAIQLEKHKVLLSHGDIFCTDDLPYQQLRQMFRAPQWQQEFLNKSIPERYQMALEARQQSQENYQKRFQNQASQDEFIEDVNQQAVEQAMHKNQSDILIHGHTHRPARHTFQVENKTLERYVLAAWYQRGSFLRFKAGQFEVVEL